MMTPAVPPVPHVGGLVASAGPATVLIGGQPAARAGDICICIGPPNAIATGASRVLIRGQPAARALDTTMHGGNIASGYPTVVIG
jgi:uncharacterized Zn-binding protein involved in type VI secretion